MTDKAKGEKPWSAFDHLPKDIADSLWQVATGVGRDYGVEADDLVGEVWLWIAEHPAQCRAAWWYDSKKEYGRLNFSYPAFRRDIGRLMVKHCQKEKAALQRSEDDQLNYSKAQVERYMPYVWHDQVLSETQPDRPSVSTSNDPAYGGNTVVCVMDIRTAYKDVIEPGSTWDKCLFLRYGYGMTHQEIADTLEEPRTSVTRWLNGGIKEITKALNGTSFGITKITTEIANLGYPGARTAISNSKAQVVTGNDIDG